MHYQKIIRRLISYMENKPTVKIGNTLVSLQDFISAVVKNIDNKTIQFNIQDGQCLASTKFTIHKIITLDNVRKDQSEGTGAL